MNLFLSAEATGAMGSSTLIMIVLMFAVFYYRLNIM